MICLQNNLEISWNNVPLSIEQAYQVLIESENSTCSLEEYRVFSHLSRQGYRLQRYHYKNPRKDVNAESSVQLKKKIVGPENGLWMQDSSLDPKGPTTSSLSKEDETDKGEQSSKAASQDIENVESNGGGAVAEKSAEQLTNSDGKTEGVKQNKKSKSNKIEIISDETFVGDISLGERKQSNTRIQRNVKLLPKRNDKQPYSMIVQQSQTLNQREVIIGSPIKSSKSLSWPRGERASKEVNNSIIK